ncbi:MAG: hypothetical protein RR595_09535 [Lysinibacillus sp.]
MERSVKMKFLLMVLIGVVVMIVGLRMYFGEDEHTPEENDDLEFTAPIVSERNPEEAGESLEGNTIPGGDTEVNYEKEYASVFGEDAVKEAKDLSEVIMKYWLENETNMEKWEAISTSPFLVLVQNEVLAPKDQLLRKVKATEVTLTKAEEKGDIQLMIHATWELISGGIVVKEQSNMYALVLTQSEAGDWLAKELNRV